MHTHCEFPLGSRHSQLLHFFLNAPWLELCIAYHVFPHRNLDFFCPFPLWGLFLIKVDYQRIHAIGMYEVVSFFFHTHFTEQPAQPAAAITVAICALWCFCLFIIFLVEPIISLPLQHVGANLLSVREAIFRAGVHEDLQQFDFSSAAEGFFSPPWQLCIAHFHSPEWKAYFFCIIFTLGRCVQVNNMEDLDLHGGAASLIAPLPLAPL